MFIKTNVRITKTHAAGTSVQPEFEDSGLAADGIRQLGSSMSRFSGDPTQGNGEKKHVQPPPKKKIWYN